MKMMIMNFSISKNSIAFFYIFFLLSIFLFISCKKEVAKKCESQISFADTCVLFNKNELIIIQDSTSYSLSDNENLVLEFAHLEEAEMALEIIKYYNFNEYCTIGRDSALFYFLSNGQIPNKDFTGEDCISYELCNLEVEYITQVEKYIVVDGGRRRYASTSQDTAMQVLETLKHFQANFACYVGRPKTNMHYMKR